MYRMHTIINSPLSIGSLTIPHRLIQGPLAGYSCAPYRVLFNHFVAPAYCVTEMSSAVDAIKKHRPQSRYLYRDAQEGLLAYQISGSEPETLASAAAILQDLGADMIDLNCGCPKTKIRKKGAGSALLEEPHRLIAIIETVRKAINIPLTVKIRIQGNQNDLILAQQIQSAGADALIVHGRRWQDDYAIACDLQQIARIKNVLTIPIIANGDIKDYASLTAAFELSGCDGFMISRAGTGRPWLYQELLEQRAITVRFEQRVALFMQHLQGLAALESAFKAVLQSKSLVRYYFRSEVSGELLQRFYGLGSLEEVHEFLLSLLPSA